MIEVYGIASCDTVRKARKWLEGRGDDFSYQNFQNMDDLEARIAEWFRLVGKERVLNLRARNFKNLDESTQQKLLEDDAFAIAEMAKLPQLIKRPVARKGDLVLTGFDEAQWADNF